MGRKKSKKGSHDKWRTKDSIARIGRIDMSCKKQLDLKLQKEMHNFELELDKITGDSHMQIVCKYPEYKEININNSNSDLDRIRIMRMRCKDEFPSGSLYFNARYTNFVEWFMRFIWTGQESCGLPKSRWESIKVIFKAAVLVAIAVLMMC